jgi:hypothetical protein
MKQGKLTSLIVCSLFENGEHVPSSFDGIVHGVNVMSEINQCLLIFDIFIFGKVKDLQLKIRNKGIRDWFNRWLAAHNINKF